jgi:predicted ATPase
MAKIKINDVGPIKKADLTLNKVNVFMGPQSSGKSTIAKIISYCTWVEKDVATSQSLDKYDNNGKHFKEHLEKYHKMNKYFRSDSYISYESDVVEMEYKAENFSIKWKDRYAYKRSKISYIPSERNMITLPEVKKVEFGDTNIRSFLFDWSDARKNYTKSELSLLNLGVNYYYNEKADEDYIIKHQNGNSYNVLLPNASSGLQSITPLLAMIDYLTFRIYNQEESISLEWNDRRKRVLGMLLEELVFKKYFGNDFNKSEEQMTKIAEKLKTRDDKRFNELFEKFMSIEGMLFSTHSSQFIIEEPEQNLFPETQRDLIYYLLEKCLDKKREHRLTITIHSPYILYALNNCMMGELVKNKMINASEREKIKCANSLINPECVSIYEIHNGELEKIQQEDGLISENYFDTKMKELMDDFYVMLNYYD